MEFVYIVVVLFLGFSAVAICLMLYEYIRYHSGLFKPKYTEEEIYKKIRFYKTCITYCHETNEEDLDNLDFWKYQKRILNRYKKLHKIC